MIKRLNDRSNYETVYSNATLKPDWNLIEEIHTQYTDQKVLQVTYMWERGHQDRTTPIEVLPPTARNSFQRPDVSSILMDELYTGISVDTSVGRSVKLTYFITYVRNIHGIHHFS